MRGHGFEPILPWSEMIKRIFYFPLAASSHCRQCDRTGTAPVPETEELKETPHQYKRYDRSGWRAG